MEIGRKWQGKDVNAKRLLTSETDKQTNTEGKTTDKRAKEMRDDF